MLKKNNRGFAVTTILYGLSIMGALLAAMVIATMSSIRMNSKDQARAVEDELNNVGKSETTFLLSESGEKDPQEYIVPEGQSGFYRIELWGSQGGKNGTTYGGGYGAYTSGLIYLSEGEHLYFYVGDDGASTEVRLRKTGANSQNTQIMVAAGGGFLQNSSGGTLYGYTNEMLSLGGYINYSGNYDLLSKEETRNLTNGTLMGYPKNYIKSNIDQSIRERGGSSETEKGGEGYYSSNISSAGGVSYISGYAGVKTIGQSGNHTTYYDTDHVFIDGRMYPGVNAGSGKAKIWLVTVADSKDEKVVFKQNEILKNMKIQYIKDCVPVSSANVAKKRSVVFSVIVDGKDVAVGKEINYTDKKSNCATLNLGKGNNVSVDEIAVWHYSNPKNHNITGSSTTLDGTDLVNHHIQVATGKSNGDANAYVDLYYSNKETETVTGIRVSAYQGTTAATSMDNLKLKSGIYYIMPVVTEGRTISAPDSYEKIYNSLAAQYLNGNNYQKWRVDLLENGNYRIVEMSRYKAMAIGIDVDDTGVGQTDENVERSFIKATDSFDKKANLKSQLWQIEQNCPLVNNTGIVCDGTYTIKSMGDKVEGETRDVGNIMTTGYNIGEFQFKIFIAVKNVETQRFRFIPVNSSK